MIVKRRDDINAAIVNSFKNRLEIRRMNVRWTSVRTECLQVLWMHDSVGSGEWSMFSMTVPGAAAPDELYLYV